MKHKRVAIIGVLGGISSEMIHALAGKADVVLVVGQESPNPITNTDIVNTAKDEIIKIQNTLEKLPPLEEMPPLTTSDVKYKKGNNRPRNSDFKSRLKTRLKSSLKSTPHKNYLVKK